MWLDLFLCLLLAHLVADFLLQTSSTCTNKRNKKWKSPYQYLHAVLVLALSWLMSFETTFWWCALVIGLIHFTLDICKSYFKDNIEGLVIDQILHVAVIIIAAFMWCSYSEWELPSCVSHRMLTFCIAVIVCCKPANIFIKLMLKHCSVAMPSNDAEAGFNAGALIGNVERWLILIFICLQRYDAIGLLIAAKSIIRFSDTQTRKTEYVLAGTLMSILFAVLSGIFALYV